MSSLRRNFFNDSRFNRHSVRILALTPLEAPAATCAGPNPAITSVAVKNVTSNASTNEYHIVGTVTNLGSQAEPSNTLQFVDVYVDRMKRTDRGIPPLRPGQSYQFGYTWTRSVGRRHWDDHRALSNSHGPGLKL